MIGPLKQIFDVQERRVDEENAFVSRLEPTKTVLLEDLIADVRRPERLLPLAAPWLDAARFTSRIAAACAWLESVAPVPSAKGWSGAPLVFFQPASVEEDTREHQKLLEQEAEKNPELRYYTNRFAPLPLAAQYLHLHTRVVPSLRGHYTLGNLRLRSLYSTFSVSDNLWFLDEGRKYHSVRGNIFGYQVPNYAEVLDVSTEIATDYIARSVVHDLCHACLRPTPPKAEGFHNVAALAAMGTMPPIAYRSSWERLVHAECTDPTFCLRAADEIVTVRRDLDSPSPLQEEVLRRYYRWYAHPSAVRKRRKHWELPDDADEAALRARIEAARADGFQIYSRLTDRP